MRSMKGIMKNKPAFAPTSGPGEDDARSYSCTILMPALASANKNQDAHSTRREETQNTFHGCCLLFEPCQPITYFNYTLY